MVFMREIGHPTMRFDTHIQAPDLTGQGHGSLERIGPHGCIHTWTNGSGIIRDWIAKDGGPDVSLGGYTRILEAIERGLHVRSCRGLLDCMVAAFIFLGIFSRRRNRLAMEWRSRYRGACKATHRDAANSNSVDALARIN